MRKRILSLLTVLALIAAFMPMIQVSAETVAEGYFTFDDSTGMITGCDTAASGEIIIPDKINGVSVKSIGDSAFRMCKDINRITIPASVTVIGDSAFYGCGNIKRIIYGGTADQWSLINVASGNDILKKVYISYAGSSGGDGEAETRTLTNFESLRSGDRMIVSFDGSVYNSSEKDENIIIALYIGDVLSQTKIYRMDAGSYKKRLYDCEFYVGDAEDVSVKAFRWTDGDCVPIEDAAEVYQCPDKTVSFSCRAVPEDYDFTGSGNIPVFSSDDSATGTIQYDLADDAELYVNGVSAGAVTNDNIYDYILLNPTGTVTLADAYDEETGEFDSKYDRVLVDRYIDAVVDFTAETSGYARVYFKWQETSAGIMEWDPSSDADITFIKDGKVISYKDINEDDVLSIKYNILDNGIGGSSLKELDYAEALVSDKKVRGMVTAVDEDSQSIIVNDTLYYLNTGTCNTDFFETDTYYDLYLDAFGYVADFTEYETLKNYGVLIWMDRKTDTGDPYVWLINTDGELVQYMCESEAEADKFYNYVENGSENYTDRFGEMPSEDIKDKIIVGKTVCTYTLDESNRISFDKGYWANGGSGLEYRSRINRLSAYLLGENTKLLYLGDYMSGSGKPYTMRVSDFEDRAEYTAYLFDKNAESVYRFGIVFECTPSEPEEEYESPLTKFIKTLPDDENSVVSPISLKLAMLMIANGAYGETQKEILDAYGVGDLVYYNDRAKNVLDYYAEEREDGSVINIANSAWFNTDMCQNEGAGFSKKYRQTLENYYNAEVGEVTNESYKSTIDSWVSEKTEGLINEIVPDGEYSLTAHVNTVYMKARWSEPFPEGATEKQIFYNKDGSGTETDFMNQQNHFYYYRDADSRILRLGYGNRTGMYIVLGDAANFESKIEDIVVDENYKLVDVAIPKFKIEYDAALADVIDRMGIRKVFGSDAELDPMLVNVTDEGGIGLPIQKAVIDVDEQGTAAAAVTYIPRAGAGIPEEEKIYDFTANRPFTYFIVDEQYGEILFAGKYVTVK